MRLFDRAVVRVLPAVPRSVVRRVASPYIAGSTLDDARRVVAGLNAEGMRATVDVLGEEIARPDEAEAIARAYRDALAAITEDGLDANISIKLTGFGLKLDEGLCRDLVFGLVADAHQRGTFVRLDMEDSSTTDATLELYRALRAAGHDGVGVVLQAALRRTLSDVEELAALEPSVRLCKGIYVEPPSVAYQGFDEIQTSFVACLDALLAGTGRVAIATHDEWLIERAVEPVDGAVTLRRSGGGRAATARPSRRTRPPWGSPGAAAASTRTTARRTARRSAADVRRRRAAARARPGHRGASASRSARARPRRRARVPAR